MANLCLNFGKIARIFKVFTITGKYLKLACRPTSNLDLCKQSWSNDIISLFNLKINILGKPILGEESTLYIGNHVSYLDIPVLLNSTPDITFVSKSEIKSGLLSEELPEKGRTIFVKRENHHSRDDVKNQVTNSLLEMKRNILIFPAGTTSIRTSYFWKKGAFEIAKNSGIKIQPFRIKYKPLKSVAYVGKDNFLVHMYHLFCIDEINVTLEFHEPVFVTNIIGDCSHWKNWCEQ